MLKHWFGTFDWLHRQLSIHTKPPYQVWEPRKEEEQEQGVASLSPSSSILEEIPNDKEADFLSIALIIFAFLILAIGLAIAYLFLIRKKEDNGYRSGIQTSPLSSIVSSTR